MALIFYYHCWGVWSYRLPQDEYNLSGAFGIFLSLCLVCPSISSTKFTFCWAVRRLTLATSHCQWSLLEGRLLSFCPTWSPQQHTQGEHVSMTKLSTADRYWWWNFHLSWFWTSPPPTPFRISSDPIQYMYASWVTIFSGITVTYTK